MKLQNVIFKTERSDSEWKEGDKNGTFQNHSMKDSKW